MDARLLATYKDARAHLNAYLDDHAFLLSALIELMQTDFDRSDLDFQLGRLADSSSQLGQRQVVAHHGPVANSTTLWTVRLQSPMPSRAAPRACQ